MMSHWNVQLQVSINEIACYQTERTLMGCADPPSKGVGAPHQCSRVNENRRGESSLADSEVKSNLSLSKFQTLIMPSCDAIGIPYISINNGACGNAYIYAEGGREGGRESEREQRNKEITKETHTHTHAGTRRNTYACVNTHARSHTRRATYSAARNNGLAVKLDHKRVDGAFVASQRGDADVQ